MNEKKLIKIAKKLYQNPHPLFGFEHGYHVMENTKEIIKLLGNKNVNKKVVFTAALLHDVAFDNPNSLITHGIESINRIPPVLKAEGGYSEEEIALITKATSKHSRPAWATVGKPESLEEKLVYDADQIEWLNVRGILKYSEIAKNAGKTYQESYESFPKDLVNRYNNIFLTETKILTNKDFLEVMNILRFNPLDYLEKPEVFELATTYLPSKYGEFKIKGYICNFEDSEALAVIKSDVKNKKDIFVRIHSECLTGEALHSKRCDCKHQLDYALESLENFGEGVIIYLKQEGRGIGLINKLKAYHLQDNGLDTIDANLELGFESDLRDYRFASLILDDLGVNNLRLMTNNPEKIKGLEKYGISVVKRIASTIHISDESKGYIETKRKRMKHLYGREKNEKQNV